jgi:carbon-monoxide dehydrogenase medium subunit
VRTRGTIGGSLAHADPAADWLSSLAALGAEVRIAGSRSNRTLALAAFVRGAMETELAGAELLAGVRIGKFSREARFGFHKICRKTGEFADAIGVVAHDPARQLTRLVASTATGGPIVIEDVKLDPARLPDVGDLQLRLVRAGLDGDAYDLRLHAIAVRRALAEALAP